MTDKPEDPDEFRHDFYEANFTAAMKAARLQFDDPDKRANAMHVQLHLVTEYAKAIAKDLPADAFKPLEQLLHEVGIGMHEGAVPGFVSKRNGHPTHPLVWCLSNTYKLGCKSRLGI